MTNSNPPNEIQNLFKAKKGEGGPVVISDLNQWLLLRNKIKDLRQSLGFVPTMGALHRGHASLLDRCRKENDFSILSIYVNPTQFNNPEDLRIYPKTLEADIEIAKASGVDCVLLPSYPQIYPDGYRYRVTENQFSHELCGQHRPGHFDGVLTVVMKLLNLVQADRAYFGEKDFQQLELIREMVRAFFMTVQIVPCPTLREQDGLAMSSRNVNLTSEERAIAPRLSDILRQKISLEQARSELSALGFNVDYIEDHFDRRFAAAHLGKVRLIDNVKR